MQLGVVLTSLCLCILLQGRCYSSPAFADKVPKDYQEALAILDRKADYQSFGVTVAIPRNDLTLDARELLMPAPFGATGWLALSPGRGGNCTMMGDLVLHKYEVAPIRSLLTAAHFDAWDLTGPVFFAWQHLAYLRIHGIGKPADLARQVKPVLDLIGHIIPHRASPKVEAVTVPSQTQLDTVTVTKRIGHHQQQMGFDTYRFAVQDENESVEDRPWPHAWASFSGTDERASVTGEIVLRGSEIKPVVRSFAETGFDVAITRTTKSTAKQPWMVLSFWGTASSKRLAESLKTTLNEIEARRVEANIPAWKNHFAGFDHY